MTATEFFGDKVKEELEYQERERIARIRHEGRIADRNFRGKGGYVAYGGTPYCSWEKFKAADFTKGGR